MTKKKSLEQLLSESDPNAPQSDYLCEWDNLEPVGNEILPAYYSHYDLLSLYVAIHKNEDSCYGVTVPDLPGCFSAGDSVSEALTNVYQAIKSHLENINEDSISFPVSKDTNVHLNNEDYKEADWYLIDINLTETKI